MSNTNQRGMSLVYVMLCLIIIGITTTALIKMSHKSSITQLHYSNSESARIAVHAGFDKALAFLETKDKTKQQKVLTALQQWIEQKNKGTEINNPWIVGTISSKDSINKSCRYRVQIVGFDPDRFAVTLHTEGIGQGTAQASAIGTYIIDGLGYDKKTTIKPTHALYLGSGADEINTQLRVNGSTFMNESGQFYKSGHIFNGEFRRHANGSTIQLNMQSSLFKGPALFEEGKIKFSSGRSTFKAGLGISSVTFIEGGNCPIVDSVGLFLNDSLRCQNYNGNFDLEDVPLIAYGKKEMFGASDGRNGLFYLTSGIYTGGKEPSNAPGELVTSPINLTDKLDMVKDLPPQIDVDLEKIRNHWGIINYKPGEALPKITKKSQLTGADLDTLYRKNSDKWYDGKWLIINMQKGDGSQPFKPDTLGEGFSGRLIVLVEDVDLAISSKLYNSTNQGITFLYLGSDKQITQMGGCDQFRGFIYANSTKSGSGSDCSLIMKSDPALHVKGSIYCVNEGHYRMEGNSPLTITYDTLVLNELEALGVFIDPNDTSTISTDLIITQEALTTELLSRSF